MLFQGNDLDESPSADIANMWLFPCVSHFVVDQRSLFGELSVTILTLMVFDLLVETPNVSTKCIRTIPHIIASRVFAWKLLLLRVIIHVQFEVGLTVLAKSTIRACEVLLAGMSEYVLLECAFCRVTFLALVTCIRSIASMHTHVTVKKTLSDEFLSAFFTRKLWLDSYAFGMLLSQMVLEGKMSIVRLSTSGLCTLVNNGNLLMQLRHMCLVGSVIRKSRDAMRTFV